MIVVAVLPWLPDVVIEGADGKAQASFEVFRQISPGLYDIEAVRTFKGFDVTGPPPIETVDIDGDGQLEMVVALLGTGGYNVIERLVVMDRGLDGGLEVVDGVELGKPFTFRFGGMSPFGDSEDGRQQVMVAIGPTIMLYDPAGPPPKLKGLTDVPGATLADPMSFDIFGDGLVDVLCVSRNGPKSSILLLDQTAPGVFASPLVVASLEPGLSNVGAADLDRDGQVDVFATIGSSFTTGSVVVFLQRDGGFERRELAVGESVGALQVADIDLDGLPDLVVRRGGSTPQLEVLFNGGWGTFVERAEPLFEYPSGQSVLAAFLETPLIDMNGDGDLDVVYPTSEEIRIHYAD